MITQSELKEVLNYDQETGIFTWIKKPSKNISIGALCGSINKEGYHVLRINNNSIYAHRAAWIYVYGNIENSEIDHVNRIKTDNRIINLRLATRSQNIINRMFENSTGYRVVTEVNRLKSKSKFVAASRLNNKRIHIGTFDNAEDAAFAYQLFIFKTFGDFLPSFLFGETHEHA